VAIGAKGRRTASVRPGVVWVTRARPGAEATASRLDALGIEAVVEPLLEVRPTPEV
jgi:uroporphyrinogen-III synthase